MASTRKKKQQNKRLFRQLSKPYADFRTEQRNRENQNEGRSDAANGDASLIDTNDPTQVKGS